MCPLYILHVLEKNKDHAGEGWMIIQIGPAFSGICFKHFKPLYSSLWISPFKLPKANGRANAVLRKHLRWKIMVFSPTNEVSHQGAKSFGELNYCYFYDIFFLNRGRGAGQGEWNLSDLLENFLASRVWKDDKRGQKILFFRENCEFVMSDQRICLKMEKKICLFSSLPPPNTLRDEFSFTDFHGLFGYYKWLG